MSTGAVSAPVPVAAPPKRKRVTERARAERRLAAILVAPAAVVMIAVTAYPVIDTIILSLQRADLRFPAANKFVGLSNYGHVLSSSFWWQDVLHTAIITVVAVSIQFVLGMLLAMAMHRTAVFRGLLRSIGLVPYAMTTGSRGVHVVCPLRRGPSFPDVHRFARNLAEAMVSEDPRHLTLEWHKADRGRRIYIDVNRIAYAQHAVAPYAVRPRGQAPVAVPVHWEELSDRALKPDRWTIRNLAARLDDGDPWRGMNRHARSLPSP